MTHEHIPSRNKTPESSGSLPRQEAEELLAYVDVPSMDRNSALEYVRTNPNALAYTDELIEISKNHGHEELAVLSDKIRNDYAAVMNKIGLQSSPYGESVSWSMWDIAKQSHLATHPEKSSNEYKLSNPFNPFRQEEKIREISSRHVGWELATQYAQDKSVLALIPESVRAEAEAILEHGERNETGQLRSFELSRLGDIVREGATAEITPSHVENLADASKSSPKDEPLKNNPETQHKTERHQRLKIAVGEKVWIKTPQYAKDGTRDRSQPTEWGDQWEITEITPAKGKPEYVSVKRGNETKKVHRAALEAFHDLHKAENPSYKTKEAVLVRPVHFPGAPKLDEWFTSIMSNPDLTPEEREHALQIGPPGNERAEWAREKNAEKLYTGDVRERLLAEGLDPDTILSSTSQTTNHDKPYESDDIYIYSDDTWDKKGRYQSDMNKALEALGLNDKEKDSDEGDNRHRKLGAGIAGAASVMSVVEKARHITSNEWAEVKKQATQDKEKLRNKLERQKAYRRIRSLGDKAIRRIASETRGGWASKPDLYNIDGKPYKIRPSLFDSIVGRSLSPEKQREKLRRKNKRNTKKIRKISS